MSNELSKKDYLKRYLKNEKDLNRKRKKRVKTIVHFPVLKIVDEDIDLKSINFGDKVEEDEADEAPVVAEVIDERPIEEKMKELYESSRWKKIDDGNSSVNSAVAHIKIEKNESKPFQNIHNSSKRTRHDSDSDLSPPRTQVNMSRSRQDSSNQTLRDQRRNSDSDISPPRNCKGKNSKHKHDSDSDISPLRHHQLKNLNKQVRHKSKRRDSDSDISPPRHQIVNKRNIQINVERHDSDSDQIPSKNQPNSPVRLKSKSNNLKDYRERRNKKNSDSDMSPPRACSELSSAKDKKLSKTLSGLNAGLQNSKTLRKEIQDFKERQKNNLETLDDEISGRNAGTVVRDRKTGLKRDLSQERQAKNEEDEKVKEYQKKYTQWGKGIQQTLDLKEKVMEDLYEMSKPMARYQDDKDLDDRLKSVLHDDDPMLDYIKKKRQKDTPSLPVYSGPRAPPNRFGILPGYRWDGVDRSNGFEKKYFEKINKTKAIEDEAYLWSVQDM